MGPLDVRTERRDEHTTADDTEVDGDQDGTQRHVVVLVDGGGDDVRATRGAVMKEHRGQGHTRDDTSYDHRHEVLTLTQQLDGQAVGLFRNDVLRYHEHEIEREDGEDGLHQDRKSTRLNSSHAN